MREIVLYTMLSLMLVSAYGRDLTVELELRNNFTLEELSTYPMLAQNNRKIDGLAKAFSVRPSDDADALMKVFCDRVRAFGLTVNKDALLDQVELRGNGRSLSRSAFVQPATLASVPFSYHRLDASMANAAELIEHVRLCIVNARSGLSRLLSVPDVLQIEGMSSLSVRHLLNNLASAPGTRYLEIGSWRGSTFVSALAKNAEAVDDALAVDAWSHETSDEKWLFGKSGDDNLAAFERNVERFVSADLSGRYLRRDFRVLKDVEVSSNESLEKALFNVYLFDGPHEAGDHEDALTLVRHHLARTFVYIVDDWNYPPVQEGTYRAIAKLGLEVLWAEALGGERPNGVMGPWHNGMWIGVLRQP